MLITDIKIRKIGQGETRLRTVVSVTFDDSFVVHEIKVIEGKNRIFVSMPNKKTKIGQFRDIAHPINKKMRDYIESEVVNAYKKYTKEQENNTISNPDTHFNFETCLVEAE